MATLSTSFTAAAVGAEFTIPPGRSLAYAATGTWTGYLYFERSVGGGVWTLVAGGTLDTNFSGSLKNETPGDQRYRFRATDDVDAWTGTAVAALTEDYLLGEIANRISINAAGHSKAGTTSGFVVAAADNIALVTCPASKTASTLVLPVPRLNVGDKIVGFHLVGQIESAGGAVTVDADLRKHTAAAADVADASAGAITQLSAAADTIMSASNARKYGLDEVVGADETFYVLVTVTTAASTDVALQGVVLEVIPAKV